MQPGRGISMLTPKRFTRQRIARTRAAARQVEAERYRTRRTEEDNHRLREQASSAFQREQQARAALLRVYNAIPDGSMLKPPPTDDWVYANEHDEQLMVTVRRPKLAREAKVGAASDSIEQFERVLLDRLSAMHEVDWKRAGYHVQLRIGRGRDVAVFLETAALFASTQAQRVEYLRMVVDGVVQALVQDMADLLARNRRGW